MASSLSMSLLASSTSSPGTLESQDGAFSEASSQGCRLGFGGLGVESDCPFLTPFHIEPGCSEMPHVVGQETKSCYPCQYAANLCMQHDGVPLELRASQQEMRSYITVRKGGSWGRGLKSGLYSCWHDTLGCRQLHTKSFKLSPAFMGRRGCQQ